MTAETAEKIYMTTKSGMKFSVSFSQDPPDYAKLAKFFLLLANSPEKQIDNKDKGRKKNED